MYQRHRQYMSFVVTNWLTDTMLYLNSLTTYVRGLTRLDTKEFMEMEICQRDNNTSIEQKQSITIKGFSTQRIILHWDADSSLGCDFTDYIIL